jgi:hypothetical protein
VFDNGRGEAGEDFIMRSFITLRFTRYYYGDQIEEDKMCGACSMHWICDILVGKPEGRDHPEDIGVGEK